MPDLRALLGDERYDRTVERLAREAADSGPGADQWRKFRTVGEFRLEALAAVLPDLLAEARDEGYQAGHEDARAVQPTYPEPTPNPYRTEETR